VSSEEADAYRNAPGTIITPALPLRADHLLFAEDFGRAQVAWYVSIVYINAYADDLEFG